MHSTDHFNVSLDVLSFNEQKIFSFPAVTRNTFLAVFLSKNDFLELMNIEHKTSRVFILNITFQFINSSRKLALTNLSLKQSEWQLPMRRRFKC